MGNGVFILFVLFVTGCCDEFQLLNLCVTGKGDVSSTKCTTLESVKVLNATIPFKCVSDINQGMIIYVTDKNATLSLSSDKTVPWEINFTAANIRGSFNLTTNQNVVVSATEIGVAVNHDEVSTVATATKEQETLVESEGNDPDDPVNSVLDNEHLNTTSTTTTTTTTTTTPPPPLLNVNVTATYMLLHVTKETTQVNKNTQAVVIAVIEGLMLAAIAAVILYKMCYLKKKQVGMDSYRDNTRNTSFPTPSANSNYYDTAAASFRDGGRYGPNAVHTPTNGYAYDQPPPSRIEMQNRTSSDDPFSLGGARPNNQTTTENRGQVESPALVPVSLAPATADPLQQWPDQR